MPSIDDLLDPNAVTPNLSYSHEADLRQLAYGDDEEYVDDETPEVAATRAARDMRQWEEAYNDPKLNAQQKATLLAHKPKAQSGSPNIDDLLESPAVNKNSIDDLLESPNAPEDGAASSEVSLNKAFTSGIDSFGASGMRLGAAVASLIPGTDAVADYFHKQAQALDESAALTPEQEANMGFGKKLVQGVGSMVPAVMLAALGGGIPAMVTLTGVGSIGNKLKEVEEGESLTGAMASGIPSAMIDAAANALPIYGQTIAKAGGISAASNVVSGFFTDMVNKEILTATGDVNFAQRYDPADLERRAIDGILGFGMGAAAKYGEKRAGRWTKEERDAIFQDGFIPEMQKVFDKYNANIKEYDFTPYTPLDAIDPSLKWSAVMQDVIQGKFIGPDGQPVSGPDRYNVILDFIAKNATDSEERSQAAYFHSMLDFFKQPNASLEERPMGEMPVAAGDTAGSPVNRVRLDAAAATPKTFLHEMKHVISMDAIKWYQAAKKDFDLVRNPQAENIYRVMEGLDKIYANFGNEILKKNYPRAARWIEDHPNLSMEQKVNALRTKFPDEPDSYGLKDFDEFVAETLTNKQFRKEVLGKVTLSPTKSKEWMAHLGPTNSVKDWIVRGLNIVNDSDKTVGELANYHLANLIDVLARGGSKDPNNAYSFDAMIKREFDAGKSTEELSAARGENNKIWEDAADHYMRKIAQILSSDGSDEEKGTRIGLLFPQKEYKELIRRNLPKLLDNRAKLEALFKDFVYDESSGKGKLGQDDRNIENIFDSVFKDGKINELDDISKLGTNVMGADQLSLIKQTKTRGGQILKAFNDKINEYRRMKEQLYYDFLEHQKPFFALKNKQRIRVMEEASFWDRPSMRAFLKAKELWWPTDAMLKNRGLTDVEVAAYRSLANGYDQMYTVLNGAAKSMYKAMGLWGEDRSILLGENATGEFELQRIPGFMPHFHDGPIKVMLKIHTGKNTHRMIMKGFNHIWQAERYIKKTMKAGHPEIEIVPGDKGKLYRVQKDRSPALGITPTLVEHYNSYRNFAMLAPEIANKIAQLDIDDARGYNKSLMKRENVSGYKNEADFSPKMKVLLGLDFLPNRAAIESFALYQRYARSVADFAGNSFFVNDVYSPLIKSKSADYPQGRFDQIEPLENLVNYITAQTKNFTGENINHFKPFDDFISDIAMKLKLNPHFFKFLNRNVRGLLSMVKLRTVRNWWANFQQPLNGIGMLYHFAIENGLTPINGGEKHSPFTSLGWAYKELAGQQTAEGKFALEWAAAKHITDELQDVHVGLDPDTYWAKLLDKLFLGEINKTIERSSRKAVFLSSYKYFTQFYHNKIQALEAADRATRVIMVNYDKAARAHMFQNFGITGEFLSPFAQYRNSYLGNTYLMFRDIARNPTKFENYKPFLAGQMIYLMQAGMLGIIGAAEYNYLAQLWNEYADEGLELPTLEVAAMKLGAPDWFTFGITSEMSKKLPGVPEGVYLGVSASAPNLNNLASPPLVPFLTAMASFALIPVKEVVALLSDYPGSSSDDLYAAAKQLIPPNLVPVLDEYMANTNGVGPRATSLEGYVDRSDSAKRGQMMTGAMGLDEWKQRMVEQRLKNKLMTMDKMVKALSNKVVDQMEGLPFGIALNDAYEKAVRINPILTLEDFSASVAKERESRLTSKRTREYLGGDTPEARQRAYLRNEYGQ